VFLLAVLLVLVRRPDTGPEPAEQARATLPASGLFGAVASGAPSHELCAARDLKLITRLNEHGEALDVPADDLRNAFLALVDARKICFSGRVAEALAIYDSVTFGSGKIANGGQTAQRQ
jgi:hypothetical protein